MHTRNAFTLKHLALAALLLAACAQASAVPASATVPARASTPAASPTTEVAPPIAWLRAQALAFDTTDPNADFADLLPLKAIIGDARLVALGEATHGTHEFFEMKHRLLRFLVQELGFNTFAIEANLPEAYRVDDYVRTGQGDAAQVLAGLYFWTWNTQEVLDQIEWMRAYNAQTPGAPLHFVGFDMQSFDVAMDDVVAYLAPLDNAAAARAEEQYACFRRFARRQSYYVTLVTPERREACRSNVQSVYADLLAQQVGYAEATSPEAFARALASARLVVQAEDTYSTEDIGPARDRYMAENVGTLLDQAGPGAKMVVWAHNYHVGMAPPMANAPDSDEHLTRPQPMGAYLEERYGDDLIVFGFAFNQGRFNALYVFDNGQSPGALQEHQILPSIEGSLEAKLASAGLPRYFLDLRAAEPGSPASGWLWQPLPHHSIGAGYAPALPEIAYETAVLPELFDVLIYFEDTTASHLLPFK
jgi:erythromycin esterase